MSRFVFVMLCFEIFFIFINPVRYILVLVKKKWSRTFNKTTLPKQYSEILLYSFVFAGSRVKVIAGIAATQTLNLSKESAKRNIIFYHISILISGYSYILLSPSQSTSCSFLSYTKCADLQFSVFIFSNFISSLFYSYFSSRGNSGLPFPEIKV